MDFDIPTIMQRYNNTTIALDEFTRINNFRIIANLPGHKPTECLDCGICANQCPQNIDIPGIMRKISEAIVENNL